MSRIRSATGYPHDGIRLTNLEFGQSGFLLDSMRSMQDWLTQDAKSSAGVIKKELLADERSCADEVVGL